MLHVHRELTVLECSNEEAKEKLSRGEINAHEFELILENNARANDWDERASNSSPASFARVLRSGQFSGPAGADGKRGSPFYAFELELTGGIAQEAPAAGSAPGLAFRLLWCVKYAQ